MNRVHLAALCLTLIWSPLSLTAAETNRFNLLVFITDQHHAEVLGCAGNPIVKTPNLDRLAREGTRFNRMFVPVPYCSPTRFALETGLYPSSVGLGRNIDQNEDPLRLREPRQTYHHPLAALGYHNHQLGKWHLGSPAELKCFPEATTDENDFHQLMKQRRKAAGDLLFDAGPRDGETELLGDIYLTKATAEAHRQWRQEKGTPKQDVGVIGRSRLKPEFHYETVLADYCSDLIKRHQGEPFAITYSVSPPHAPWIAPAPFYDQYDPAQLPLPASWTNRPAASAETASARMTRIYGEAGFREYLRCYYAQVTMMDWCFGRILKTLDELKLTDRTLIVFTSDHGNMLGQHGMMDKTLVTLYDDLMRVPFLMRLPGAIPAGKTVAGLAQTVDLPCTILDYLDAPPLTNVHGASLRGLIEGKADGRTAVFGERGNPDDINCGRMIRTQQWKLCLVRQNGRELYNLERDPEETRNVADDPANAEIVKTLEQQLWQHMQEIGDPALPLKRGNPK
ncbi:MAG: sulfatase-like hydrolase/transferase [Verrucomicrobiota bacterium]